MASLLLQSKDNIIGFCSALCLFCIWTCVSELLLLFNLQKNRQNCQSRSLVRPKNHAGLMLAYIWPIPGHYNNELICKEYLTTT